MEKLDRVLVTDAWLEIFGEAKARSLVTPKSDHMSLILWPLSTIQVRRCKKFKFENLWLNETQCREVMVSCWENTEGLNLLTRLGACSKAIWEWGRS